MPYSKASPAPPPRWATPLDGRPNFGAEVDKVARLLYGRPLMPWQRLVAEVATAHDGLGNLAYREVVLTVPRQNGKSHFLGALRVWRCLSAPRQLVASTAQTRNDARDRWEELAVAVEGSPLSKVAKASRVVGSERIAYRNGSADRVLAPTEKAGHGLSVDLVAYDEVWAAKDGRLLQTYVPAMAARPNPQLWLVSTAGTIESRLLASRVEVGRDLADDPAAPMAYFEWSAPDDADPDDPEVWAAAMPAYGNTIGAEAVKAARHSLTPGEFRRAFLNQWTTTTEAVIPAEWWAATLDPAGRIDGPVTLGVDVAYDRQSAAVAAAGPHPDPARTHAEVIAHRPGVGWVVPYVLDRLHRHHVTEVVIDPAGPVGSILPELSGHLGDRLTVVNGRGHAAACAQFFDACRDGSLSHLDQPALLDALAGATRRPLGDSWAWGRKGSTVDLSPLVAVTLAHGAAHDRAVAPAPSIR